MPHGIILINVIIKANPVFIFYSAKLPRDFYLAVPIGEGH